MEQIRSTACLVDLDVLIYSGYVFSRLKREHSAILELADAIISGPYVESRFTNLPWRGSSNQRLVLLTDRAVERFALAKVGERSLQVSADGGEVWITGIPRRGDLQRLEAILTTKGVVLEGVSWRA
jgi:anaerobic ribonucleoside-triphosphate reductase activating protein